jgi:hypothetical protein
VNLRSSERLSLGSGRRAKQADTEILDVIDPSAIALEPPVSHAKNELALEYALHVHAVDDLFYCGKHLIGELDLADA